jgi:hypothetical protein
MTTHFLLVVIPLKFLKASFPLFEENEPEPHVSIQVVCVELERIEAGSIPLLTLNREKVGYSSEIGQFPIYLPNIRMCCTAHVCILKYARRSREKVFYLLFMKIMRGVTIIFAYWHENFLSRYY